MVIYQAIKETHHHPDIGEYTAWGIKGQHAHRKKQEAAYIQDVFLDETEAVSFARLCTRMKLSLVHLPDVVEDFLES